MKTTLKKAALYIFALFFIAAGINHFVNPAFYLPLIPPYFPFPETINIVSGVLEIVAGGLLLFPTYRAWGGWLIVAMMLAFIPSHVYFIQMGNCIPDGLCVPAWVGWARLLVIHPLLIYAGFTATKG
jgi:uncharacterized membrane protein